MQRTFNIVREYGDDEDDNGNRILDWRSWMRIKGDEHVVMMVENDADIYHLFLNNLPEDVGVENLIQLWRANQLPTSDFGDTQRNQQFQFESTGFPEQQAPWSPKPPKVLSPQEAMQLFQVASARSTKGNQAQTLEARHKMFLAFNTDPELAAKLGMSLSQLNSKVKGWTGFSSTAKKTEEMFNRNIPPEHAWSGISNASWINRQMVSPEDLDQFVKQIEVSPEASGYYGSQSGQQLRQHILRTFLSIDTRLNYKDLSFALGNITQRGNGPRDSKSMPRGIYTQGTKKIVIADNNPHTVAHEIGHFIDHNFGNMFGLNSNISGYSFNYDYLKQRHPPEQVDWLQRMQQFMKGLTERSSLSSRYMQEPSEAFARFIDKFVRWTAKHSGAREYNESDYSGDSFNESDYRHFVSLLQQKSFLDARYPLASSGEKQV